MSRFTKYALIDSFTKLLKKKSFSKITVKDIAESCGISRMTFYYHFDDIYDMIDWSIEEKLKKAIDKNFTYTTWRQGYLNVFKAVEAEKSFFLKVFPSIDLRRIELYLHDIANEYIMGVINEKCEKMSVTLTDKSKNFVCEIYGYTLVGVLLNWISNGMKEQPEELVNMYSAVLSGTLERSLLQAASQTF